MVNETASTHTEVECLFCGQLTPRPEFTGLRRTYPRAVDSAVSVALIRCQHCGKEAPYPAGDLIRYDIPPKSRSTAA